MTDGDVGWVGGLAGLSSVSRSNAERRDSESQMFFFLFCGLRAELVCASRFVILSWIEKRGKVTRKIIPPSLAKVR